LKVYKVIAYVKMPVKTVVEAPDEETALQLAQGRKLGKDANTSYVLAEEMFDTHENPHRVN
jgi:antitoxin component of RelBE/YafQ-DinJ toxin-antitoxin module